MWYVPKKHADDHDDWIAAGMALHVWDPVAGLPLWQEWSRTKSYPKPEKECAKRWKSFHADGKRRRTLATLMKWASANGWKGFRDPATILDNGWEALRLGKLRDVAPSPSTSSPTCSSSSASTWPNACNGIDPAVVATHLLAISGGLMGRSVDLRLGESRYASACLFAAVVRRRRGVEVGGPGVRHEGGPAGRGHAPRRVRE